MGREKKGFWRWLRRTPGDFLEEAALGPPTHRYADIETHTGIQMPIIEVAAIAYAHKQERVLNSHL